MVENKEAVFFDRDLSWLAFNGKVLAEAADESVPLLERIKFLSIYSSNLDEFYRVRMPVLMALDKLSKKNNDDDHRKKEVLTEANSIINAQLNGYGKILTESIIPQLKSRQVFLIYKEEIPANLADEVSNYFLSQVLAFIQIVDLSDRKISFFPNNNELYDVVNLRDESGDKTLIINIPSNHLPRFYSIAEGQKTFIVLLDDIIKSNLPLLFPNAEILGCHSFKITRTAEIDLKDEYAGDLAKQIEKQLQKRDFGLATRFLHQPGISDETLAILIRKFNLKKASIVEGGQYHNLKDFADFPYKNGDLSNPQWPKINYPSLKKCLSLHQQTMLGDILINPPYQSYNSILRFFNEAATDNTVEEIYITLYRVASDSKIVNSLMNASRNGKKVSVLVELKARFDEANNIKWANKMKEAGVNIIYSVTALKVHAKIALVKRRIEDRTYYTGLLATGNFNETTANFYTDHILMTANHKLLREMELLFMFLAKRTKPENSELIKFKHLLVAQFNLKSRFLALIDREIENAQHGKPAAITIKLNNLEEKEMIDKLYQASQAGVKIELIIRGICRLVPGVKLLSQNIKVRRIVDRYLEHGRIFVFENNGEEEIYMGSADWMNRNLHHRIEVCFPIYDKNVHQEIKQMLKLQLNDNVKAVKIDQHLKNVAIVSKRETLQSQYEIYKFLQHKKNDE
jgi:polyphosphate kinase